MNEKSEQKFKKDPMLVKITGWSNLIDALSCTYTISTRQICRLLKCDRAWVAKYVKPNVPHIFVSGKGKGSVSYLDILSYQMQRKITESIWYDREKFERWLYNSITSCTRQTIRLPYEMLIKETDEDQRAEVIKTYNKLFTAMEDARDAWDMDAFMEARKKKRAYAMEHLAYAAKKMYICIASPTKRSDSPAVPCNKAIIRPYLMDKVELKAPHDQLDYGDATEDVYRRFYMDGCYRIEINATNPSGQVSKKIYYINPHDEFKCKTEMLLFHYNLYLDFVEDKEDLEIASQSTLEWLKSGREARPIDELWAELGL